MQRGRTGRRHDIQLSSWGGHVMADVVPYRCRIGLLDANLNNANLHGADLLDANLHGADLRWANLEGATMP